MGDRRRSRRLAAALAAAGIACATAACGSGSGSAGSRDPNTFQVSTRSDPDDAATYVRVFAAFTKKTGIKIDALLPTVPTYDGSTRSTSSGCPGGEG